MNAAVRSFFFAVAAAVALAISRLLEGAELQRGLLGVIAAVVGVASATVVEFLLLRFPLRFRLLRRLVDRRAAFEGTWLINVSGQPERPLALATIEYNASADDYNYHGVAFDESYQVQAAWHSIRMVIDLEQNQIAHIGEGTTVGPTSETVRNFGLLNFERDRDGRYTRGYAFFVDFGAEPIKRFYTLERVPGRPRVATHDDVRQLLKDKIKPTPGSGVV